MQRHFFSIAYSSNKGSLLLGVLVFAAIGITLTTGFVGWAVTLHKVSQAIEPLELVLQFAEVGIDYYRWHLAKDPVDYEDGTGDVGPYTHTFYDKNNEAIGEFVLTITPPTDGNNQVTIESTGTLDSHPTISRTIRIVVTKPTFNSFALVSNASIYWGPQYEVYGPIHSNGGIRFDGVAHNLISSSVTSYDDGSHSGSLLEHGVHTHVKVPPLTGVYTTEVAAEAPPSGVATRTDVFAAGRSIGINAVDWNGHTTQVSNLKAEAQSGGRYLSNSGNLGYHIVLKTNDTMDVYRVARLTAMASCDDTAGQASAWAPWQSWTIKSGNGQSLIGNYAFPSNGVIFADDNVWVDGTINGAQLTIVAGTFPESANTYRNIIINSDLNYTNFDGTDALGLIAQGNIILGLQADTDLAINAAMISQYGHVWRNYFNGSRCNPYNTRNSLTIFGSIASFLESKFAYPEYGTNGYSDITITYDGNLPLGGSPFYPTSSEDFQILSWEEFE